METVTCCLRGGSQGMVMRGNVVHSIKLGSDPACAGVRKGDRVVKVDDTSIIDDQWFCLEALIGDDDTEVTLTLQREVAQKCRSVPELSKAAAPAAALAPMGDWLAPADATSAAAPAPAPAAAPTVAPVAAPAAAAPPPSKGKGHVRRSSAPPGFGSLVSSLTGSAAGDKAHDRESQMVSPRTVLGDAKEAESPVNKMRSWWATKKDKQPAIVALPTMPFLDEAFEDDANSPGFSDVPF